MIEHLYSRLKDFKNYRNFKRFCVIFPNREIVIGDNRDLVEGEPMSWSAARFIRDNFRYSIYYQHWTWVNGADMERFSEISSREELIMRILQDEPEAFILQVDWATRRSGFPKPSYEGTLTQILKDNDLNPVAVQGELIQSTATGLKTR